MQNTNLRFLFLAGGMPTGAWIGIIVGVFVVAIALGALVGYIVRKKLTDKKRRELFPVIQQRCSY